MMTAVSLLIRAGGVLFFVMGTLACSQVSQTTEQERNRGYEFGRDIPHYPEWFLNPAQAGADFSTGYAPVSFFTEKAAERASEAGKKSYQAQNGIRLEYTSFWEQLPDDSFRKTGRELIIDTLGIERNDLKMLASTTSGRMTIAAVGKPDAVFRAGSERAPGPMPSWVQSPPDAESGMYAVGYHAVYYNEHESWRRAELYALKALARAYRTEHQRVERVLNGASEATTLQTSRITVESFRVVARWRDLRNSYVLIHAQISE